MDDIDKVFNKLRKVSFDEASVVQDNLYAESRHKFSNYAKWTHYVNNRFIELTGYESIYEFIEENLRRYK